MLLSSHMYSQKQQENQAPVVIQCQTFTTWNEGMYLLLLATKDLALHLSYHDSKTCILKNQNLIVSFQMIIRTQRSQVLSLCFQKHFHYQKKTTTLIPLREESLRKQCPESKQAGDVPGQRQSGMIFLFL